MLPKLPQLIPIETAYQPDDDRQRQGDLDEQKKMTFLQGGYPVPGRTAVNRGPDLPSDQLA
jgi:hypothetical protein